MTTMTPIGETLGMLFNFLFTYSLLFILLPMAVLRFDKGHGLLDKVFISLTHTTLFFIVATHLLVGVRLLETLTLLVIAVIAIYLLVRRASGQDKPMGRKVLTTFFDLFEEDGKWRRSLRLFFDRLLANIAEKYRNLKDAIMRNKLATFGYIAIFAAVAVDRFAYSFTRLIFSMPDPYTHLGWSKYMSSMMLYVDGVYPYGFEAIATSLYYLFRVDLYGFFRFIGPTTTLLIMLSLIYAFRSMNRKDHLSILLTLFLFAFSSAMMLHEPSILMRQISGLSMEYTTIFLLPGIVFFYRYLKTDKKRYLLLAAETYCITTFSHPFVTVTMTIALVALGLAFLSKILKIKRLLTILLYMGAAGFIGVLPMLIGLLTGKKFHGSSVDYIEGKLSIGGSMHEVLTPQKFAMQQPFVVGMLIVFAVFIFILASYAIYKKINRLDQTWDYQPFVMSGIFLIGMIVIMLSRWFELPTTVPYDRQPVFLSLSVALFFGLYWPILFQWIKFKRLRTILQLLISLAIVISVLVVPGLLQEKRPLLMQQYDEAVRGYLDIKNQYPYNQWTIISPVDELGIVWGYGFHWELWEFVRDLEDPDIRQITFPTPYVFLYVEKVPLDMFDLERYEPVTLEEARVAFPQLPEGQPPTEFYYWYDMDNRRILMAKTYFWAEAYMQARDDTEVFLETDKFIIYKIDHDSDEVILDKRGVTGW